MEKIYTPHRIRTCIPQRLMGSESGVWLMRRQQYTRQLGGSAAATSHSLCISLSVLLVLAIVAEVNHQNTKFEIIGLLLGKQF